MNLKYYNPEIHKASFILPEFARKVRLLEMVICDAVISSTLLNSACVLFVLFFFNRYSVKHDTENFTYPAFGAESTEKQCCPTPTPHSRSDLQMMETPSNCFQCLGTTDNERWKLFWVRHKKKGVSGFFFSPSSLTVFIYYFKCTSVCLILTSGIVLSCLVL